MKIGYARVSTNEQIWIGSMINLSLMDVNVFLWKKLLDLKKKDLNWSE